MAANDLFGSLLSVDEALAAVKAEREAKDMAKSTLGGQYLPWVESSRKLGRGLGQILRKGLGQPRKQHPLETLAMEQEQARSGIDINTAEGLKTLSQRLMEAGQVRQAGEVAQAAAKKAQAEQQSKLTGLQIGAAEQSSKDKEKTEKLIASFPEEDRAAYELAIRTGNTAAADRLMLKNFNPKEYKLGLDYTRSQIAANNALAAKRTAEGSGDARDWKWNSSTMNVVKDIVESVYGESKNLAGDWNFTDAEAKEKAISVMAEVDELIEKSGKTITPMQATRIVLSKAKELKPSAINSIVENMQEEATKVQEPPKELTQDELQGMSEEEIMLHYGVTPPPAEEPTGVNKPKVAPLPTSKTYWEKKAEERARHKTAKMREKQANVWSR